MTRYVLELKLQFLISTVYLDIYGCQMNVSDTELVMSILEESGYTRTPNQSEADIWMVMTCSIREGAENKGLLLFHPF